MNKLNLRYKMKVAYDLTTPGDATALTGAVKVDKATHQLDQQRKTYALKMSMGGTTYLVVKHGNKKVVKDETSFTFQGVYIPARNGCVPNTGQTYLSAPPYKRHLYSCSVSGPMVSSKKREITYDFSPRTTSNYTTSIALTYDSPTLGPTSTTVTPTLTLVGWYDVNGDWFGTTSFVHDTITFSCTFRIVGHAIDTNPARLGRTNPQGFPPPTTLSSLTLGTEQATSCVITSGTRTTNAYASYPSTALVTNVDQGKFVAHMIPWNYTQKIVSVTRGTHTLHTDGPPPFVQGATGTSTAFYNWISPTVDYTGSTYGHDLNGTGNFSRVWEENGTITVNSGSGTGPFFGIALQLFPSTVPAESGLDALWVVRAYLSATGSNFLIGFFSRRVDSFVGVPTYTQVFTQYGMVHLSQVVFSPSGRYAIARLLKIGATVSCPFPPTGVSASTSRPVVLFDLNTQASISAMSSEHLTGATSYVDTAGGTGTYVASSSTTSDGTTATMTFSATAGLSWSQRVTTAAATLAIGITDAGVSNSSFYESVHTDYAQFDKSATSGDATWGATAVADGSGHYSFIPSGGTGWTVTTSATKEVTLDLNVFFGAARAYEIGATHTAYAHYIVDEHYRAGKGYGAPTAVSLAADRDVSLMYDTVTGYVVYTDTRVNLVVVVYVTTRMTTEYVGVFDDAYYDTEPHLRRTNYDKTLTVSAEPAVVKAYLKGVEVYSDTVTLTHTPSVTISTTTSAPNTPNDTGAIVGFAPTAVVDITTPKQSGAVNADGDTVVVSFSVLAYTNASISQFVYVNKTLAIRVGGDDEGSTVDLSSTAPDGYLQRLSFPLA